MQKSLKTGLQGRGKFIIGGGLILAAMIYLIVSATQANAEYFMTVNELKSKGKRWLDAACAFLVRLLVLPFHTIHRR